MDKGISVAQFATKAANKISARIKEVKSLLNKTKDHDKRAILYVKLSALSQARNIIYATLTEVEHEGQAH